MAKEQHPEVKSAGGFVLPMQKVKAETKSPKNLVIFSKPKVGKTTLLSALASIPEIKQGNVLFLAPTGKAKVRMEENAKK